MPSNKFRVLLGLATTAFATCVMAIAITTQESAAQPQGGGANRCYFGNNCRDPNSTQAPPVQVPAPQPQPNPNGPPVTVPQPTTGEMSSVCQFTAGPNPGGIVNFVGFGDAPVGTYCQDHMGNRGSLISRSHPFAGMAINLVFSSRCYFNFGPLTGQIVDYAQMGKVIVGTPCNDGLGSLGYVIQ